MKADKEKYDQKKETMKTTEKRKGNRKPTMCGQRGLACFTGWGQSALFSNISSFKGITVDFEDSFVNQKGLQDLR